MFRHSRHLSSPGVALALAVIACQPSNTTKPPEGGGGAGGGAAAQSTPASIIAASQLPKTHEALPGDPMGVSVHRLANGLTVYISTDRQKPRFSAWVAVRTGSRNDPAASTGLAHYLEHMLFKGSDQLGTLDFAAERPHIERIQQLYADLRGTTDPERRRQITAEIDATNQKVAATAIPNELDRVYAELGISGLNAFTSWDETVYISDVPSNRLEAWAGVESERFKDPVFRLFFTEMEAVYEEKNLSLDSPLDRTFEALTRGLFPRHPYGTQTTIGEIEHLKVPAYQDTVDYFKRWYVPNNMAVLLAGDIDAKTALPVLERTLGTLAPAPLSAPEPGSLAPITARVASEVVGEGEQEVWLSWATVPQRDADEPALTVMDWVLDNSTSGLLPVALELSQKVPDAGSSTTFLNEAGWVTLRAQLREGQTHAEVEKLLLDVIDRLRKGEFSQADLDAIRLHQEIARKRELENSTARVYKMMNAFINRRDWSEVVEREERLRKVTREDVIRVANKYLGPAYSAVYRKAGKPTVAKIEKPTMTPVKIDADRRSAFAEQVLKMPAAEMKPEWLVEGTHYKHVDLPAGPMIAVKNERNDLFAVVYRFERGHERERLLCHALEVVEASGAGDMSPEALKKKLFALGTTVRFFCSSSASFMMVDGIDAGMEASLALVDTWLRQIKIDPATLAAKAENVISQRRDAMEEPDSLADAAGAFALYGPKSEYLLEPTNAQISGAKPDALAKLAREYLDHTHRTIYFGPRAAEDAAKAVGLGKAHRKVAPRRAETFRKVSRPTFFFAHRDVAKSTITLALPAGVQTRAEKPAATAFTEYFSGAMNSLLFQEMREARGLVYYSWGAVTPGARPVDAWALRGGLGTQSDKTVDALTTYFELIKRPIDKVRFASAKAALDQEFRSSRVDPRNSGWAVMTWDEQGEARDPRPERWEAIGAMTPEQLQAYVARYAKIPPTVGLVGNRERVDLGGLRKLGEVVEVAPEKLFSYGPFPKKEAAAPPAAPAAAAPAAAPGLAK